MSKQKEIIGGPVMMGDRAIPLSWGVRAGDFVFFSGIVACDETGALKLDGDIAEQTRLSMQFIEQKLKEAGCELKDVVKASVFLKNPEDFPAYNAVYGTFFSEEPPARFTVATGFMVEAALVEIEVIAYKPQEATNEG